MKKYLVLFILLASCGPEESPIDYYEGRETVEVWNQELVEVQYKEYSHPVYPGQTWHLVFKRANSPQEEFFTVVDTVVFSQFIHEFGRTGLNVPFTGNIASFVYGFNSFSYNLKLLVSGKVKAPDTRDMLPGPPFLLEK